MEALRRPEPDDLPRPRLLACDIDGTLLDEFGALRTSVREAVATIAASGVTVVLATGRSPWSGIAPLAASLGLIGPQITMQGALVSDPATGAIVRARPLPAAIYLSAIRFADELGLDPIVGMVDGHRAERIPEGTDIFVTPLVEGRDLRYVSDIVALVRQRPIRVYLHTGPERHRQVREAALRRFGGSASIVWSDHQGLEILARGTHKGEAVAWFAARLGIGLDAVAAVGDAANDIEMLRRAGRSAAMASAGLEVRAAADIVVPSAAEGGAVHAFAWFFPDLAQRLTGIPAADGRLERVP